MISLRRSKWLHTPAGWISAIAVFLLVVLIATYVTYLVFVRPIETAFAADVRTTQVSYTSGTAPSDPDEAGLFAVSQPVRITILGCRRIVMLASSGESVPCQDRQMRSSGAIFSSLQLAYGTAVEISIQDGDLHLRLQAPGSEALPKATFRALSSAPSEARRGEPGPGDWQIELANTSLDLVFHAIAPEPKPVHAGAAPLPHTPSPFEQERDIHLAQDTGVFFNTRSRPEEAQVESALIGGKRDSLLIARTDKKISLDEHRLELRHIHDGTIRSLEVESDGHSFSGLHVTMSGSSREIFTPSIYDTPDNNSSNRALNRFDSWSHLHTTASLIAALATFASILKAFKGVGELLGFYTLQERTLEVTEEMEEDGGARATPAGPEDASRQTANLRTGDEEERLRRIADLEARIKKLEHSSEPHPGNPA